MPARVRRPDIDKKFAAATHGGVQAHGLLLHLPDVPGGDTLQPHLLLRLRSGAELRLTPAARSLPAAAARDAVLGCAPPGSLTPVVMRRRLAPAASRLHRAAMAEASKPELVRIGPAAPKPPVSLIVPLYRNLGFMRFQLAALAQDPQCRGCEIVFVLDSPEQRAEVEHLLRGLHRLTAMPVSLVVMSRNLGYAASCNAGGRVATAPLLLYEDSDFCLRIREAGGTILYVPEAELFNFERRSIQLHAGYTRTHASLYNRLLHHARWDGAMAAAMATASRAQGRAA